MSDKLLDFVSKRNECIEKKRRNFERIMFSNFLGAYTVLDAEGSVYPIELVDISRQGCLFSVPWDPTKDVPFNKGHELNLRIYFTKASYIPVVVKVIHSKEVLTGDGSTCLHYGCEFDKSMPSFGALESFIEFMYRFAEHSRIDRGDTKVFFL
jgi:hypothetical protein